MRTSFRKILQTICSGLLLVSAVCAPAQTLARPGWAGSGLSAEDWWHAAVFYRVDVRHFEDSDGDGVGDLAGLAQRMDYVQSLGVDAVVLLAPFDDAGFDGLLREASGRHIRLVVGLDPASPQLLGLARQWMTRGAAGIYLQRAGNGAGADVTGLLRGLRGVTGSFPGRIVVSEVAPGISLRLKGQQAETAQLVDVQIVSGADVLEREMTDTQARAENAPLLLTDARFRSANAFFEEDAAQQKGMNKILATVLLSFRGAVSLRYGQELGLAAETGGADPKTMQWTPSNLTPQPKADLAETKPVVADPNVFGAYVPYVKPKPGVAPGAGTDPDSLKGFTAGVVPELGAKTNRKLANVALEDADPNSLLNFYRRLVQLHHGNASVRNGVPQILDHGAESALVWVRRAPAGARTAANVVVACNLGEQPLTLSLTKELDRLRIGGGVLRPLLASWSEAPVAQSTDRIVLPGYSVFVGELSRAAK